MILLINISLLIYIYDCTVLIFINQLGGKINLCINKHKSLVTYHIWPITIN